MRRTLLTLAASAALGLFLTADASACCHKKKACPEPVCAPAPVCAPVECAPRKHCGFKFPKFNLCHKRQACAPAPVCETVVYTAPAVYATGQAVPSAQQ